MLVFVGSGFFAEVFGEEASSLSFHKSSCFFSFGNHFSVFLIVVLIGVLLFLFYRQRVIIRLNVRLLKAEEELKKKNEELHRLSGTDPLTGFFNRRAMEKFITEEMYRNKRFGHPVSILMMDLDDFKKINDTFGHSTGDLVLKEVAEMVRANIRVTDRVSRWGGEEFLILSANTGLNGMIFMGEKIRKKIMNLKVDGVKTITVSIGVSEYEKHEDFSAWCDRADKALYNAKMNGRNRVAFIESEHRVLKAEPVLKLGWKQEFLCGNKLIDRQHMKLFNKCNEIIDFFLAKQDVYRVHFLIDELYMEVAQHFSDEEDVLKKCGFPGLAEHAKKHADLVSQFMMLKAAYQLKKVDDFIFLEFLAKEIVLDHLVHEDREFFNWVR